jgi:hypothetical protein
MKIQLRDFCGLMAVLFALSAGVSRMDAQATAAISGTVTDSSGAAIADAAVQVKNSGTGIIQTTTSDAQGRFRMPELIIGAYEVQASKTGGRFSASCRAAGPDGDR